MEMNSDQKYELLKEFFISVIKKELKTEVTIADPRMLADLNCYRVNREGKERFKVDMKVLIMDKEDYEKMMKKIKVE